MMWLWLMGCAENCDREISDAGIQWAGLCAGAFWMGSDKGPEQQQPRHLVQVPNFHIARSETTVGQYEACVQAGACRAAAAQEGLPELCSYGREELLPMTCVNHEMATSFCQWAAARLPSEAEWEFAARSRGKANLYPWGKESPSCELAAVSDDDCMPEGVLPVCTKPKGNTEQGLCDLAGNAFEWVADNYHSGYDETPVDGSPDPRPSNWMSMRGGGFNSDVKLATRTRTFHEPDFFYSGLGFRCARSGAGED